MDATGDGESVSALFDVRGFPTLLRFQHGKYSKHQGERTLAELKDFAEKGSEEVHSFPNPYLALLDPLRAVQRSTRVLQGVVSANPLIPPALIVLAVFFIFGIGFLMGKFYRDRKMASMWVAF